MSNIFHELKRGFLILGFTGPLSSGCTSAAKFFEKDINLYIEKRCTKVLPKLGIDIKRNYNELQKLKQSVKASDNRSELYNRLRKLSYQIKEQLILRETLLILRDYQKNVFKYISMTDILLKLILERLSNESRGDLPPNLLKLKETINYDPFKLSKVKEINGQIKNREISDLTEADIDIYEDFLDYIRLYKKEIKTKFSADDFGTLLQDLGDNARRCGNPIDGITPFKKENARTLFILAEEANSIIKFFRNKKRSGFNKTVYKEFVIEAFRNPYEIEYFRNRYYEFYLYSINAPLSTRKIRGNYNQEREKRDRGYNLKATEFYKQNVGGCVHLSDIAINNDTDKKYIFERKLSKYYSLICRPGCIPPSEDELFMQEAYCMSVKSNCISRQVGAIIVGKRHYIIGAGWNDVGSGQIPCGLRKYSDLEDEHTPFPLAVRGEEKSFSQYLDKVGDAYPLHSFCFKDEYSKFKTTKKIENLQKQDSDLNAWKDKFEISDTALWDLSVLVTENLSPKRLEYCRALHAEENAILQTAIIGGIGIEGSTIYTTTFPCELCAKKIYQSRIKKVVYTEPYPESISEDVFFKDGSHSVELVQFEGVKSHSYYRLYKSPVDKKEFQAQERLY